MNGGRSPVRSPQEGETLTEYLQRYTDEELRQFQRNPEWLISFCRILQERFRDFERVEDGLENLWRIVNRINNFDRLLYLIRCLEPVRRELLRLLEEKADELNQTVKLCTIGRILGSSVDIAGTIGGLSLRNSDSTHAHLAFRTATAFGLLGFVSTTTEMYISKHSLDVLMKLIRKDQELMGPIQRWYQRTDELEEAMQEVFPFDVTNHIVAEFAELGENEITPARLLATLLRSIAEQDVTRLRDVTLIRNLINFTLYPASQDWCQWVIFRRHPVMLDITRIILQLQHSPLRFSLCQSLPALAVGNQSISSFPVWSRIALNVVSITDAINSLRNSEISPLAAEMRHLRSHLQSELAALLQIAEFVRVRRSSERDQLP